MCRKGLVSDRILRQFCRCWVHRIWSGIRGTLKEDSKFKYHKCASQPTDVAEDCPGIKLNGQPIEIVEKYCYLHNTIGAKGGTVDSITIKIRSEWITSRDLVTLLASRGLPLGTKGRLHSACICSVMLCGSET